MRAQAWCRVADLKLCPMDELLGGRDPLQWSITTLVPEHGKLALWFLNWRLALDVLLRECLSMIDGALDLHPFIRVLHV